MSAMIPLTGTAGLACGYLSLQPYAGDGSEHQLGLESLACYGNQSLFTPVDNGFQLTHRVIVTVDIHASCDFDVVVERMLSIQLDKGASGGLMERGSSYFIHGQGNSYYQGILEAGHIVRGSVSAPGDQVLITWGYFSISAVPV